MPGDAARNSSAYHLAGLQALQRLVSADVGIVNRIDEGVTPYDHPRVATAYAQLCDTRPLMDVAHAARPAGMATDTISVRLAALGEAVERYSACHVPPSRLRYADEAELAAQWPTVPPEWLDDSGPRPPVAWVRGCRLDTAGGAEPAWLAASRVFLGTFETDSCVATATSTGLACHPDPWQALRSALLEVIERDAVMTTWYTRAPVRPVRTGLRWVTSTGHTVSFDRAVENYRLFLLDSPTGIPVVLAVAFGADAQPAAAVGAAAHLDVARACRKALLEAHQTLRWAVHMTAQGRTPPDTADEFADLEDHVAYYLDSSRMAAFDFLVETDAAPLDVDLDRVADDGDARADVIRIVARAASAGIDCYCADATAPDVRQAGFWVIRAVIPALYPLLVGTAARPDHPRVPRGVPVNPDPHPFP